MTESEKAKNTLLVGGRELELLERTLGRPLIISPDPLARLSETDPDAFELLRAMKALGERMKDRKGGEG
jgi:hypothetical protein